MVAWRMLVPALLAGALVAATGAMAAAPLVSADTPPACEDPIDQDCLAPNGTTVCSLFIEIQGLPWICIIL
jgi:hypothetical protein